MRRIDSTHLGEGRLSWPTRLVDDLSLHPDKTIDLAKKWRQCQRYAGEKNHGIPDGFLEKNAFGSIEKHREDAERGRDALVEQDNKARAETVRLFRGMGGGGRETGAGGLRQGERTDRRGQQAEGAAGADREGARA